MAEREDFCLLTSLMSLLDQIKSQQVHLNYFELELVHEVQDGRLPSQQAAHTSSRRARTRSRGVGRGRFVTTPLSPCFSQGLTSPALRPLPAADWVLSTLAKKEDCIHFL